MFKRAYYAALLDLLSKEINIKMMHMVKKIVLFYHDNAPTDTAMKVTAKLHELNYELLHHLLHSLDLSFSDYY